MSKMCLLLITITMSLCACGDDSGFLPTVDVGPEQQVDARGLVDIGGRMDAGLTPADAGPTTIDAGPCMSVTNEELCARADLQCGMLETVDECEVTRSVDCGSCGGAPTCGGAGTPGRCGCITEETDAELCDSIGAICGTQAVRDACGISRAVVCGSCSGFDTCGGGDNPVTCGCTPETNAALCTAEDADCGMISTVDRCGAPRDIACGSCASPLSCGGGGTANRCGCALESDAVLCASAGATCGDVMVRDRCGTLRTVSCGGCGALDTCGGGGTANECGCTPETDAALCSAAGAACGAPTVTDSCGGSRTPSCGTCAGTLVCDGTLQCAAYSEPFDPICSAAGWCWENPRPQGNDLEDVATIGPSDVWAVGGAGTVLRWNGTRWSGWAGAAEGDLHAVWAQGTNDVWIVGDDGSVLRWNGTTLQNIDAGTDSDLFAVWGSGPNDVWVGGTNMLRRWNGVVWTEVAIDTNRVTDLYGFNASDVWATGYDGTVLHFDGVSWTTSLDRSSGRFYSIWGANPTDLWAVGYDVYRFNGTSWSRVSSVDAPGGTGVWGTSATDVWLTRSAQFSGFRLGSKVSHFDGLAWSQEQLDLRYPTGFFGGGGGSASPIMVGEGGAMMRRVGGVWVSIQSGIVHRSMIFHDYSGTSSDRWEGVTPQHMMVSAPLGGGTPVVGARQMFGSTTFPSTIRFGGLFVPDSGSWNYENYDVDQVARTMDAGGASTLWTIDSRGRVRQGAAGAYPQVLDIGGSGGRGGSIWAAGNDDIWAVKEDETHHWNGTDWMSVPNPVSGTTSDILAMWGASSSALWAVGEDALILRWNGTTWTTESYGGAPTSADFIAIDGRSSTDVWVAGGAPLSHWNGTSWTSETAPTSVRSLHADDSGAVWIVGINDFDAVLHRRDSGGAWSIEVVPFDKKLYAVDGQGSHLWVVGDDMAILSRGVR